MIILHDEEHSGVRTEAIIVHMLLIQEFLAQEGKNKAVNLHCTALFYERDETNLSNQIACSSGQLDLNQTICLWRMT